MTSGVDGDFSNCEARSVAFLETNIGGQTTFIYQSSQDNPVDGGGDMVRMCIKGINSSSSSMAMYHVDMPVHQVLRYTNANKLDDAIGMLTIAASAGALSAFVMHNQYWGTQTTSVSCLGGNTPFRGVPIIDVGKLVVPIADSHYLGCKRYWNVVGTGRKAKVSCIDMGFKVFITPSSSVADKEDGEGKGDSKDEVLSSATDTAAMVAMNVYADVSLKPRSVKCLAEGTQYNASKAFEFRLAPHGHMDMDTAHVLSLFVKEGEKFMGDKIKEENHRIIMNLDFNASHEIGGLFGGDGNAMGGGAAGTKHRWCSVMPSAIDESSSEGEDCSDESVNKKIKKAGMEVADTSSSAIKKEEEEDDD